MDIAVITAGFALSFLLASMLSRYLFNNACRLQIGKRVYCERARLHRAGVPRLGGIVIYGSFFLTLSAALAISWHSFHGYRIKLMGIFLASTILLLVGAYDDLVKRLGYRIKFAAQIAAAVVIVAFGYSITVISSPFTGTINIGVFGALGAVVWMLVIINAINLVDGLDGLACGISIIACLVFFAIESSRSNTVMLFIIASFIGGGLAFLRYNFYPARLFLGDSGSLFIGFMVGILAIESVAKRSATISLAVPLLVLFIPAIDIFVTFSRRIASARNPFKPDLWHMHYRLLRAGLTHRDTVLAYYTVTSLYAALGLLCFVLPKRFEILIIGFSLMTIWVLYVWAMHFVNLSNRIARRKHRKTAR